jgi:hypothetical protein
VWDAVADHQVLLALLVPRVSPALQVATAPPVLLVLPGLPELLDQMAATE